MDWRDRVPACFGEQDLIFAWHPTDEERTKKAIREAKAAGASRDDFEKEMVWHIYKNVTADGFLQEHTKEQVRRLHKMWRSGKRTACGHVARRSARQRGHGLDHPSQHYQHCRQTQNCHCEKYLRVGRHLCQKLDHASDSISLVIFWLNALTPSPASKRACAIRL